MGIKQAIASPGVPIFEKYAVKVPSDAPMVDESVGVDQWSKRSEVPQHIFVFSPL